MYGTEYSIYAPVCGIGYSVYAPVCSIFVCVLMCHPSAVCHPTLGLVIGGKTGTAAPFGIGGVEEEGEGGADRDFNPHPSEAGWGKTEREKNE